mmetsp:Transcript_34041/g.63559  ORF Transcript_34041/g.63559 Transcript_34041/m.63559 type:complete len:269 (+) Transcript_34041:113-919(+)
MESLPGRIQEKLEQGEWEWDDLPTTRDDATSWRDVETGCGLTKQELSRVKNARCPGGGVQEQDIAVLKEQVAMLRFKDRISTDPRLALFSPAIKSKDGKHSVASDYHRSSFPKCVFCESENNVTMAHLISEVVPDDLVSLASFGPPQYHDALDVKSPRNFIRLCGVKGENGTCHDAFDHFRLSLLYNPAERNYTIIAVNEDSRLHLKVIGLSLDYPPYKRLLCWRFRQSIVRFGSLVSCLPSLNDTIDYSEAGSVSGGDEDSSTSESI